MTEAADWALTDEEDKMRDRNSLWVIGLLVTGLILYGHLSYAGDYDIAVSINGTTVTAPNCGADITKCVEIAGPYGSITVTPITTGAGRLAFARVEVPEAPYNEALADTVRLVNTRITNTGTTTLTNIPIVFEHRHTPGPATRQYYKYNAYGTFGPAANNKIRVKGWFKWPSATGTWSPIQEKPYTVTCTAGVCLTNFNINNYPPAFYPPNPSNVDRTLKIEFWLDLQPGSYVDLGTGVKMYHSASPDDLGNGSDCPECTKKSDLSVFCSTTYSTAKMFGCPSCVTEDGQVAADAKVKLFASTNWDNLLQDMARGEGEHLTSLAALLKVPANRQLEFFELAQEKYRTPTGVETPEQVVISLHNMWSSH